MNNFRLVFFLTRKPIFILALSLFLPCCSDDFNIQINEFKTVISQSPNKIDSADYDSIIVTLDLIDTSRAIPDYENYYPEGLELLVNNYKENLWIETPDHYGGLKPNFHSVITRSDLDSCLTIIGGLSRNCYSLIINDGTNYKLLNSKEKFRNQYRPIESAEEALAYVSIYTNTEVRYQHDISNDFRFFVSELELSNAISNEKGFIVTTFYHQLFGCGNHSDYMRKYQVDVDGNIELLESVKIYEDPALDDLCVD